MPNNIKMPLFPHSFKSSPLELPETPHEGKQTLNERFQVEEEGPEVPDFQSEYAITQQRVPNVVTPEALEALKKHREEAESIRNRFGGRWTSVYRNDRINDLVGGAKGSKHTKGLAFDLALGAPYVQDKDTKRAGYLLFQDALNGRHGRSLRKIIVEKRNKGSQGILHLEFADEGEEYAYPQLLEEKAYKDEDGNTQYKYVPLPVDDRSLQKALGKRYMIHDSFDEPQLTKPPKPLPSDS
jgi:hypothetical protein